MISTIETIKEMRDKGKSIREIARIMGKSAGCIAGIMGRNRDVFPIQNQDMQILSRSKAKEKQNIGKTRRVGKLAEIAGHKPSGFDNKKMGKSYWDRLNSALSVATGEDFQETETYVVSTEVIEMRKSSANAKRKMFHEELNPLPVQKPKEMWEAYDQSRMPGVSLLDLDTKHCCRWPITEHPKGIQNLFCGEVKAGKNYCTQHQQRSVRMV